MALKYIWIVRLFKAYKQVVECLILKPVLKRKTYSRFDPYHFVCKTEEDGSPKIFKFNYVIPSELSFGVFLNLEIARKWKSPICVSVKDDKILFTSYRYRTDQRHIIIETQDGTIVFDSKAGIVRRDLWTKPKTVKKLNPVRILLELGQKTLTLYIPKRRKTKMG